MGKITIELVQAHKFVRTSYTGDSDLAETSRALLEAARIAMSAGGASLVIDCRRSVSRMTVFEIVSLVQLMLSHREMFTGKLALLVPDDGMLQHMQFMEDFAINRGLRVGAFSDFEQALIWLMPPTLIPA